MNEPALNTTTPNTEVSSAQVLELRDIHLPDPISWWPIAPGWWIIAVSLFLIIILFFIIKKIHASKQLKRNIKTELEIIKQQFQQVKNKSQLAKSLSVLLRRASISYYPKADIAGLTGNDWLIHLDRTGNTSEKFKFQSDIGNILLSAPYLPDNSKINFDDKALINLCESWLLSTHKSGYKKSLRAQTS